MIDSDVTPLPTCFNCDKPLELKRIKFVDYFGYHMMCCNDCLTANPDWKELP